MGSVADAGRTASVQANGVPGMPWLWTSRTGCGPRHLSRLQRDWPGEPGLSRSRLFAGDDPAADESVVSGGVPGEFEDGAGTGASGI